MEPKNNGGRSALSIFLFIAVPLAFFVALWMVLNPGTAQKTVTEKYSEYIAYFEQNQVQDYTLDLGTGALQLTLRENYRKDVNGDGKIDDKDVLTYKVPDVGTFLDLVTPLVNANNRDDDPSNNITYNWKPVSQRSWIISHSDGCFADRRHHFHAALAFGTRRLAHDGLRQGQGKSLDRR